MANDLLNPPDAETAEASQNGRGTSSSGTPAESGHELDAFLGKAFEEKSSFASLFDGIHEVFFPTKLPPLELTSTPIPVADPMAVKRSPLSIAISAGINLGILALLLFAFRHQIEKVIPINLTGIDVNISPWKPTTPKSGKMGGGGGGGSHDIAPPIKGHLPKIEKNPLLQPQVPVIEHPKIAIEPAINVQQNIKLPDNPALPTIGMTNSPNVTLASNGQGGGGGMGTGKNGGLGSGNGNGYGPGTGGNVGGGLYRVGDGVSPPRAIFQPEAEFSDEARRAKYEGTVVVTLIVDANGNPQNVHVTRTLGMGLDEKAVEAVQKYKFKPAVEQKTGKPVPVMVSVEVRFRLY
ncbi:MAG TPA: energy transducer TonB [Acidobacteriaceae bacterium]|jgi:TonB family protein|nr:energy transducer TonB [Acidobacteriaceae bacterium]